MRLLQISHDWKWTGPAEPMLRLALAMRARGHEVHLACPEPPDPTVRSLAGEARAAGLPPALVLARSRGVRPLRDHREAARLRRFAAEHALDLVHAWHTRDHLLAVRACRGSPVRVARTWRRAELPDARPWTRWLLGPGADGLWCVSPGTAAALAAWRPGRPTAGGFGAVDLERFAPGVPPDPGIRAELGLAPEDRVVGIVARVQPHRRWDLFLEAARRLCERDPGARLLVVGRGTRRDELAVRPAEAMGLKGRVLFAGYRSGDYLDVLRCIDVFTLLVPGSDGSCRAVLEAAACGIPAVVTPRGALPEIVVDGETGRVCAEDPAALADAWGQLLADPAERRRRGEAAARRARSLFAPARLADGVEALYRAVLAA